MGFLDQIKTVWPLVTQAPWVFTSIAVALLLAGWVVGRFMYSGRIALLKEAVETLRGRLTQRDETIEGLKAKLTGSTADAQSTIGVLEKKLDALGDPRLLSQDQLAKMAVALRRVAGTVHLTRDLDAMESVRAYSQMRRFFKQQGWEVTGGTIFGMKEKTNSGLTIYARTGQTYSIDELALTAALDAAGIAYDLHRDDPAKEMAPLQLNFTDTD